MQEIGRESIMLTLIKAIFEGAVEKMELILAKHRDIFYASPRCKHISQSITSALFLCHVRYFLEYALRRMYLTPEQERRKELYYRKLWHCQEKSIQDVARSSTTLERQRLNHGKMLEDTVKRHRKNVAAIHGIDKRCNDDVANINTRYEKKQIAACKAWEYERNEMQVTLGNVRDDLDFLKDVDTNVAQTRRERKLTIESKLLARVAKYETEIGSRCRTLEKLDEVYQYDKLENDDLEKEMKRQEDVYLGFIKLKEKTGVIHFDESLVTFERARSARIIQRWWRKFFWDREGSGKEIEEEEEEK